METTAELAEVLELIKPLRDIPALIEVVIPPKDLAPQLARLAPLPAPLRKYGGREVAE